MSGFVIFALPVSNGVLGIAPMPGRGGHYAEDLAHLRDWSPAMVISMTEPQELVAGGAVDLPVDVPRAGIRWVSFPVRDYGVGATTQEPDWDALSAPALAALKGGGRVLIHCRGGCGRSGMAALRLMVRAGADADTALERLRKVRPCAVETPEQLEWARQG